MANLIAVSQKYWFNPVLSGTLHTFYTLYEPQTSFISEMRKLKTFFLQKILKLQELLSSILCQVL